MPTRKLVCPACGDERWVEVGTARVERGVFVRPDETSAGAMIMQAMEESFVSKGFQCAVCRTEAPRGIADRLRQLLISRR